MSGAVRSMRWLETIMACRESYIREYEAVDECYYDCPACKHGRYIMGMVIHDKAENYTYFQPFEGEDICNECGGEMEKKLRSVTK